MDFTKIFRRRSQGNGLSSPPFHTSRLRRDSLDSLEEKLNQRLPARLHHNYAKRGNDDNVLPNQGNREYDINTNNNYRRGNTRVQRGNIGRREPTGRNTTFSSSSRSKEERRNRITRDDDIELENQKYREYNLNTTNCGRQRRTGRSCSGHRRSSNDSQNDHQNRRGNIVSSFQTRFNQDQDTRRRRTKSCSRGRPKGNDDDDDDLLIQRKHTFVNTNYIRQRRNRSASSSSRQSCRRKSFTDSQDDTQDEYQNPRGNIGNNFQRNLHSNNDYRRPRQGNDNELESQEPREYNVNTNNRGRQRRWQPRRSCSGQRKNSTGSKNENRGHSIGRSFQTKPDQNHDNRKLRDCCFASSDELRGKRSGIYASHSQLVEPTRYSGNWNNEYHINTNYARQGRNQTKSPNSDQSYQKRNFSHSQNQNRRKDAQRKPHQSHNNRRPRQGNTSTSSCSQSGSIRPFGFRALERLSKKDPEELTLELSNIHDGLCELIKTNLTDDTIVVFVQVLRKVADSTFFEYKYKVLQTYLDEVFIDKLIRYIAFLPMQRKNNRQMNKYFWRDPDDFWNNLIRISQDIFDTIPDFAREVLPPILDSLIMCFPSFESQHSRHISDEIKENVNMINEAI